MDNGTEPKSEGPISYPRLEIPGKGTFRVKFSLGAVFSLEEMGVGMDEVARALQEWMPRKAQDGSVIPGRAKPTFLFKVLAACIGDQIKISPSELAYLFDLDQMATVAQVVAEAFSKMRAPAPIPLREPAPKLEQPGPN